MGIECCFEEHILLILMTISWLERTKSLFIGVFYTVLKEITIGNAINDKDISRIIHFCA